MLILAGMSVGWQCALWCIGGIVIGGIIGFLIFCLIKKDFKNAMDNIQFTGISVESIPTAAMPIP